MDLNYHFDPETLREVPSSTADMSKRIDQLLTGVQDPSGELVGLLRMVGRLDEARAFAELAVQAKGVTVDELGVEEQLPVSSVPFVLRYAHVLQWRGELDHALRIFTQALDSAKNTRMASPVLIAFALQHRGKCLFDLRDYRAALADFEEALTIRRMIGSPKDQVDSTVLAMETAKRKLDSSVNFELPRD